MGTRQLIVAAGLAVLLAATAGTASAKGCIVGGAAGAVAGHVAGHHAVIGAVGGCIAGRHLANKKAKEQADAAAARKQNEQEMAPARGATPNNGV